MKINSFGKRFSLILVFIIASMLSGCAVAPLATIPARQIETQKITLGNAQSRLKVGMSSAEVVEIMGSPNIVTQRDDKTEVWVYDKVFTESEQIGGARNSAVVTTASKTFLLTVKFDKSSKVEDISYRQTSY